MLDAAAMPLAGLAALTFEAGREEQRGEGPAPRPSPAPLALSKSILSPARCK